MLSEREMIWPSTNNFSGALLKSFLICNEYPNVELILIESAQNQPIREWFKSIDFESNFQNFEKPPNSRMAEI